MMEPLSHIDWTKKRVALPAFITAVLMPFTYSIAYGLIGGIMSTLAIEGLHYLLDKSSALSCAPSSKRTVRAPSETEEVHHGMADDEGGLELPSAGQRGAVHEGVRYSLDETSSSEVAAVPSPTRYQRL